MSKSEAILPIIPLLYIARSGDFGIEHTSNIDIRPGTQEITSQVFIGLEIK